MASRVLPGSVAGQSAIVSDADGSFVLPGIGVVTARLAFNLALDQGDFSLTGGETTSAHGYTMPAATGVLALTGFDATYALVEPIVDFGAFALVGGDASLRCTRVLTLGSTTFTLTGKSVALSHGYNLSAGFGVFVLTGGNGLQEIVTDFSGGAITLTGFGTTYALVEPIVDHGDFILSGGDMLRRITAKFYGGEIDLQGMDVGGGLAIPTTGGTFALTGSSVTFYAVGKLLHTGYFDLVGGDMRRGLTAKLHSSAYELTGFPLAGRSSRTRRMEAGRFSLSGAKSSIKIVRLGGVSGVGAIQWREAGATLVDWIS